MQVEFVYAAFSAMAVAPRDARCDGCAGTNGGAASTMSASPARTDVRSGHDDKTSSPRRFWTRTAKGTGVAAIPVGMTIGMQLAGTPAVASTVLVTDRSARAAAIVHDGAARVRGSSAGLAEVGRSDAAFSDGASCENGPKKGVMKYDAGMAGREAVRQGVVANVTGS
jgi:hypothetical protein